MPLYGPKFPLSSGNHDTFALYEDVISQISFFLKNLILTSPGENISDPDYGVGLRRYLFEPNISSVRSLIESSIRDQIYTYLPYLTLESVSVSSSAEEIDSNLLRVVIKYGLPDEELTQIFELEANPEDTIGFY